MGIFLRIIQVVLVLAIWLAPFKALAANFQQFELQNLIKNTEKCDNQDTCLGMCSCEIDVGLAGSGPRKFRWTVYKEHINEKLFRFEDRLASNWYAYEAFFNFDRTRCNITLSGDTTVVKEQDPVCKYYAPFCCCATDAKTGEFTDCKRQVHYTNEKPVCSGIGSEYKYQEGSEGKECAQFKEEYNKPLREKRLAEEEIKAAAQRGTDVKFESRKLNELTIDSPEGLIGRIIQLLMGFMGSILFGLYIYAGVLWMTARGDSDHIEHAKKIMFWATAGVVVMLASYIIVSNIFNLLTKTS